MTIENSNPWVWRANDLPPSGAHPAVLENLELRESRTDERPYFYWVFQLEDVDVEAIGLTSAKFSGLTNGGKWAKALLGRSPERKEGVGPDELVGCHCIVVVEHNTDSQGEVSGRVVNVLPAPTADLDDPF